MKKNAPDSDPPFDARKFWLSSAAIFAGVLVFGLLPSCSKAAEPQQRDQGQPARLRDA
jgi:hypothetical protein